MLPLPTYPDRDFKSSVELFERYARFLNSDIREAREQRWKNGHIPHDLEQWFLGCPWSESNVEFHVYWKEVFEGQRQADNFIRFGDGAHELSHLIVCADADVMDPYFGSGTIDNPYAEFSAENPKDMVSAVVEWEVAYIFCFIENWTHPAQYFEYPSIPSYDGVDVVAAGARLLSRKFKTDLYKKLRSRFPTIDSIWAELERKRALVQKALG